MLMDRENMSMHREALSQEGFVSNKPILKAGRWKASSFLLVYQSLEVMIYFGITANLVIYLTTVLHEGTVNASKNVSNWIGVSFITPMLGAFFGDALLGRYWSFVLFAFCYILGLLLLNICVWLPSLEPPPCGIGEECTKASNVQVGIFYLALYIIAVGTGAIKPNVTAIGANQFDQSIEEEKPQKTSFFNWWIFGGFAGSLTGQTIIVYIQDNVGFKWGYTILTISYLVGFFSFFLGTPFYRRSSPRGNPFSEMAQVLVAAIRKRDVLVPSDPSKLYEVDQQIYASIGRLPLPNTNSLRCLDKAATKQDSQDTGRWRLCPVTQVEETKMFLKLLPVWFCNMLPNIMVSTANTLFVKQATTLDRRMGSNFQIPPGSLGALATVPMLITIIGYDRFLVKVLSKMTGRSSGLTPLQRVGVGLGVQTLAMMAASITESRRLHLIKDHGLLGDDKVIVPASVFILAPQCILFGISSGFVEPAFMEFFYEEAPEGMKSTSTAFLFVSSGIGFFLCSLLLTAVNHISGGKWVQDNINSSRLDYYYACLVVLCFLNMALLVVVSKRFTYKKGK